MSRVVLVRELDGSEQELSFEDKRDILVEVEKDIPLALSRIAESLSDLTDSSMDVDVKDVLLSVKKALNDSGFESHRKVSK